MPHCSLLKATGLEQPTATCCACDVCDQPGLLSMWLDSHDDYSPTSPSLHSLWLLTPSNSLTRWEQVEVYYYHPRSRVLLDPVYHIIYLGDYLVWDLPGLVLGQFPLCAGWTTEPHFVTLMVARTVGQHVITSFHLVTGQLQVLGIIVDSM
jgi:hypothetical protein